MGQRNMHITNLDSDQEAQDFILPEPCLFYGGLTTFPRPNMHAISPAPGSAGNFNFHHLPEHCESALLYGMAQYNQYPSANLNLVVTSSSNHYAPYLASLSTPRDFPVPVNHGTREQLPFLSNHWMVGIQTDSYGRNNRYVDGVRGSFKRKNVEGLPWDFQYCDTLAGSSSYVAPMSTRPLESDATMTDAAPAPFVPPAYAGNDTSSIIEDGSHRSVGNRPSIICPDSVLAHNANHLIQGNYVNQPFHLPRNPWMGPQFSGNGADINTVTWNHPSTLPYVHGGINGGCVDVGNMGPQGYQVTANRNLNSFLHTLIPPRYPSVHHPPPPIQGVRGHNLNFPSQVLTSLGRSSTNGGTINSFHGIVEAGPRYIGPVPPTGFWLHRPYCREVISEMSSRHRNIPHLRVLPEDGVAMLEVPGYHEAVDSPDQHRDMRLDTDHMSYENLLALGEQIGNVGTGLSEDSITNSLKTRSFSSSAVCSYLDEGASVDQEIDFCAICQTDYKDKEKIGTLDCSHEYHVDCIRKWLLVKNTCPICKSKALTAETKHF